MWWWLKLSFSCIEDILAELLVLVVSNSFCKRRRRFEEKAHWWGDLPWRLTSDWFRQGVITSLWLFLSLLVASNFADPNLSCFTYWFPFLLQERRTLGLLSKAIPSRTCPDFPFDMWGDNPHHLGRHLQIPSKFLSFFLCTLFFMHCPSSILLKKLIVESRKIHWTNLH